MGGIDFAYLNGQICNKKNEKLYKRIIHIVYYNYLNHINLIKNNHVIQNYENRIRT